MNISAINGVKIKLRENIPKSSAKLDKSTVIVKVNPDIGMEMIRRSVYKLDNRPVSETTELITKCDTSIPSNIQAADYDRYRNPINLV